MAAARVTLFLGGARSGKSRLAQAAAEAYPAAAEAFPCDLVYLATAQALDLEMTERIDRHRADRGPRWRTIECPLDLPATIARESRSSSVLLVDCLTLWLTNLMLGDHDADAAGDNLVAAITAAPAPVLLVSNEVGLGIVPDNPLARAFRDSAGRLNQRVAAVADSVLFVAAGLALRMK